MGDHKLVLLKVAIALCSVACFFVLRRSVKEGGETTRLFLPGCFGLWFITRLGLFFVLYLVMGLHVPSDVPTYYHAPGKCVLEGKLVYRDFTTSYGPLFSYVAAGAVAVWDSPRVFVLLAIGFEGIAILLWHRAAHRSLSATAASLGTLLCLCNPLAILNVTVGQNQSWLSAFMAAGVLMLARREWISGWLMGLSVAVVKVLGFMFLPLWWLVARKRWHFTAALFGIAAVTMLPFWLAGADVLSPVKREGELTTSGNLPFLLSLFGLDARSRSVGIGLNLLLMVSIVALSFFFARHLRLQNNQGFLLLGMSAILLAFMLLSKKSYTNYLNLLMPAVCCSVVAVAGKQWFLETFLVWSGLATLEPSLWHRWFMQASLGEIWRQPGDVWFKSAIFTLIELLLVGGYGILLWLLVRSVRTSPNALMRSLPSGTLGDRPGILHG